MVTGALRRQGQGGVLLLEQVADPVGLPVHCSDHRILGAQAPQHVELDVPDHPGFFILGEALHIGPGAVLPVLLVGEADEADLRTALHVLQGLCRVQQGRHAGGVVVGAVGGGHAVVVGGEDQDVRTAAHRLLHGDDVGAGAAALVGVGLAGDGVAHLLKAPGNIVRGVRLPLRPDGPGLGGEDLQVLPDVRHIRQVAGALEHGHRLGHCDGVPRGQGVRGLTVHEPRLDAPG